MNERTTTPCDDERLRLLLANELPPELEAEAAEHVAECAECRRKLESMAGDQDWWTELKSCLSLHTGRMSARRLADTTAASHTPELSGGQESFSADFAVDFLEPCEQAESLGRLDDIEILEVIGRGGMGIVLKGFQRELGRFVAVKVMAPHLAASGSARQRFAREARAAAAVVHPHVMAIHSVSASGRLPYMVMPFVACESLQQRLDRDGPFELKEILRIGRQVAAGLSAAHAQGLVHRDVKPANILLEKGVDRVMLTDFGLARAIDDASLTRTGLIAGTPQFMSPEQARGDAVDPRSDLFSLGSVLYAMCTGRPPFRAETSYGILRRITDTEPRPIREVNADIPQWLEGVVAKLHGKSPEQRFDSAVELHELLEQCLAHVQQPNTAPLPANCQSAAVRASKGDRLRIVRSTLMMSASVAVAGLLVVGSQFFTGDSTRRENAVESDPSAVFKANRDADDPDPATAWDATASGIDTYRQDVTPFEMRSQHFWDATSDLK